MRIRRFVIALAVCAGVSVSADTLTFVAQPDSGTGSTNLNWFSADNWFRAEPGGNLVAAGRVPQASETTIITGTTDPGSAGVRVQTLVLTNGATLTNGTFAVENLQMLSGSTFRNTTINLLASLTVVGTNCSLSGATLNVLANAEAVFLPAATLDLEQGAILSNAGRIGLSDGSELSGGGVPQSKVIIQPGAILACTDSGSIRGHSLDPLMVDHNGLGPVERGQLTFTGPIAWQSSAGLNEFRAVTPDALVVFDSPFAVPAGATSVFTGAGTNRWAAGATIEGIAQIAGTDPVTLSFNAGNLEVSSPVSGSGTLRVAGIPGLPGLLHWSEGTLSLATLNIDPDGQMLLLGPAGTSRALSSTMLNNSGRCTLASPDLDLGTGAVINNLLGATFEAQADGTFFSTSPNGGVFNNAGLFRKTGAGTTRFGTSSPAQGLDFNNMGLADIQNGQLNLMGGTSSGEFRSGDKALLWFWGGTHTLNSGARLTGAGAVQVAAGAGPARWLVKGDLSVGQLEVSTDGLIIGPGEGSAGLIQVAALLATDNGSLTNGNFQIQDLQMLDQGGFSGSAVNVSRFCTFSATNCTLRASSLTILPTASAILQGLTQSERAVLNLVGGSILSIAGQFIQTKIGLIKGAGGTPNTLLIQPGGKWRATGSTEIQGPAPGVLRIDNSGLIRAEAGTLTFGGGLEWHSSASRGQFQAAASAASIWFASPLQVERGVTSSFSGPGSVRYSGGVLIDGTMQIGMVDPGTQSLEAGHAQLESDAAGSGIIHVLPSPAQGSVLTWSSGTLGVSSVNIDAGGALHLAGSALQLSTCLLNNAGLCSVISGDIGLAHGSAINNLASGVFELQADTTFAGTPGPDGGSFSNAGIFEKATTGTTRFGSLSSAQGPDFSNSGTLEINHGTVDFRGTWVQTSGTTMVGTGATLRGNTLNLQRGLLGGNGTVAANINNQAEISPGGSPGVLLLGLTNDYTQGASGKLFVELGGTNSVTQFDQLVVGGRARLDGQLEVHLVNGFVPHPGDQFAFLKCASQSAAFTSITGDAPAGTAWVARYLATNVTLVLAREIKLGQPVRSAGSLSFPIDTTPGLTYTVQKSDRLAPADWKILVVVTGDGTSKLITDAPNAVQCFYRVVVQ